MIDLAQKKKSLFLWLIIPLGCCALYPVVKTDGKVLEWLTIALTIYVLFFSVVMHELCHGIAAKFCGDPLAEESGRLTLNPLAHVSPVGSVVVPLVLYFMQAPAVIGWAKPVPFDPTKLKHFPRDQVLLAISGPLANFAMAAICFNVYLIAGFAFNRVFAESPIHFQLDIFMPITFSNVPLEAFWFVFFEILSLGMIINLILGVFNLIPFPPLDGSWILKALLPNKEMILFSKLKNFGFIFLLLAVQFHLLEFFLYPTIIVLVAVQQMGNYCLR